MTIIKREPWINRENFLVGVPVRRSTGRPLGNGRNFCNSSSDSSDSDLLEPIDGHLCQLGDQVCEFPAEIFDVPDLKEIVSLETWNTALDDEERETLAAYLPCMDEATFRTTLKSLFSGEGFNFSSPIEVFLQMLKSGEFNPKASRYRQTLQFLQKREHHCELRAYHNRLVNSFLEMQNLWKECPDSNLAERLQMWKALKFDGVKLTPQYFAEKRGGPLHNRYYKSLLRRKECYTKAKGDSTVIQSAGSNFRTVEFDSKDFTISRKHKREVNTFAYNASVNVTESGKKIGPKGVLKLLSKPVSRTKGSMDVVPINDLSLTPSPDPQGEKNFDGKLFAFPSEPTVSRNVDWSSALRNKKSESKKKSESRVKAVECRKLSSQASQSGLGSYDKGMNGATEGDKQQLLNITFGTVAQDVEDVPFSPTASEEALKSSDLSQQEGLYETKAKAKEKNKFKGSKSQETGRSSVLFNGHSTEDAYLAEKEVHDILDDKDEPDAGRMKRKRKRSKVSNHSLLSSSSNLQEIFTPSVQKMCTNLPSSVPAIALTFPFSIIHLLSAVRLALTEFSSDQSMTSDREGILTENLVVDQECLKRPVPLYLQQDGLSSHRDACFERDPEGKNSLVRSITLQEIVTRVQANPGDPRILEAQESLQELIRGVLKVLSCRTSQAGIKGWKPLVMYNRVARGWSWIGPLSSSQPATEMGCPVVSITAETWMISSKMLYKLQELFGNWLKHEQEILQQLGQLALTPPLSIPLLLDEKERFRELRAQKSLMTIHPTPEEMRAYFRKEEALRYSVPDRAFLYTSLDGRKSAVAPLRRTGGKPNSKARDHFMLKHDRPPHVTILCLVRDAAARLPGSIGTRADVCSLLRDSQYIVEDVSDVQLNNVVSGALDRLHYERDPCVRFDGDRKLWVYLHTDKEEEDFEDDATSSTKRWRRMKKDGTENSEVCLPQDFDYLGKDDQDANGLGLDLSPPSCFGGPNDLASVYSAGGNEMPYPNTSSSPLILESAFSTTGREDSLLHFIDLPPTIQPPCVNMRQSHPMGWEVLSNKWETDIAFQSQDQFVQEDYGVLTSIVSSHREGEILIDGGI
ncbi:hypothetical protein KP509_04G027000 [Ceratopteris richardii]|uniref:DEUBAD domain-containing protein n=4 Tax=Ceratopteris richardii TaxID=49495 RepID=A0A8T2UR41_CERRI|nr:hypothetical protein KP509_04G027000 [Ceratopteris richardii]